jgi:hypothetical protein
MAATRGSVQSRLGTVFLWRVEFTFQYGERHETVMQIQALIHYEVPYLGTLPDWRNAPSLPLQLHSRPVKRTDQCTSFATFLGTESEVRWFHLANRLSKLRSPVDLVSALYFRESRLSEYLFNIVLLILRALHVRSKESHSSHIMQTRPYTPCRKRLDYDDNISTEREMECHGIKRGAICAVSDARNSA